MQKRSLFSGTYGGRRHYSRRAEINMTPFVDVMLVLLIVFMVSAPLMSVSIPVDLPEADAPAMAQSDEPLIITVTAQGDFFLQEEKQSLDQILGRLQTIKQNNPDLRVFIRGDQKLSYGQIMAVMGALNQADITRIALIAQLPDEN